MVRKISLLLILLFSLGVKAQVAVGDWTIHTVYGSEITSLVETSDKIYYLVNKNLFQYSKTEGENECFTKRNKLSDILITGIFYNYDKKFLLIAYQNGNIDLLYDDGKIVNMSDIKDVILSTSKTINAVAFDGDRAFLATDFGYLILNTVKHEVVKSQIYNSKLATISVVGDNFIVGDGKKLYLGEFSKIYPAITDLKDLGIGDGAVKTIGINNNSFFLNTGWAFKCVINSDNTVSVSTLYQQSFTGMAKTSTGFMLQTTAGELRFYDANGDYTTSTTLPTTMTASVISAYSAKDNLWILDAKGLKNSRVAENGTETVLSDYFRPNVSTVDFPYNMVYNSSQNKLYTMNIGANQFYSSYNNPATIDTYDGFTWKSIVPASIEEGISNGNIKQDGILRDPYSPVFDPDDPSIYYIGSWFSGVYKMRDDKMLARYCSKNSPIPASWSEIVPGVQFDKNKNLWLCHVQSGTDYVMILPRANQSKENLTASDWKTRTIQGTTSDKKMHFLITKKSDIKLVSAGAYGSSLSVLNDNSTIDTASDDVTKVYSSLTDQDEKSFEWHYIHCFAEDANGRVWMGTDNGVIEFNPANATNSNFRINRIKVPRNDGTSYADYLLENTEVTCIAVDGANRKWIGTSSAGLFLVSSDGSEIINKFTTDNSYLLDNHIISISCNTNNNSVYIGTPYGVVEYSSDASAAESSYDNVYAYPNPVRPGYSGWITVRGLMENSLVKITDAMGNVVFSGTSTGGMITWDGKNSGGARVTTGVYYVYASSQQGDNSSGAVTKIMIIN